MAPTTVWEKRVKKTQWRILVYYILVLAVGTKLLSGLYNSDIVCQLVKPNNFVTRGDIFDHLRGTFLIIRVDIILEIVYNVINPDLIGLF